MSRRNRATLLGAAALALLTGAPAPAQQTAPPGQGLAAVLAPPAETALRGEIERPGVLIVTRSDAHPPVALAGGARVVVHGVGAFQPGREEQRVLGIRIDVSAKGLSAEEGRSYLDIHEIEALLRSMTLLTQLTREPAGELETEADFKTIEGFTVGIHVAGRRVQHFVRTGREEPIQLGLSAADFNQLRQTLEATRDGLFQ